MATLILYGCIWNLILFLWTIILNNLIDSMLLMDLVLELILLNVIYWLRIIIFRYRFWLELAFNNTLFICILFILLHHLIYLVLLFQVNLIIFIIQLFIIIILIFYLFIFIFLYIFYLFHTILLLILYEDLILIELQLVIKGKIVLNVVALKSYVLVMDIAISRRSSLVLLKSHLSELIPQQYLVLLNLIFHFLKMLIVINWNTY